jgi:hypothetical protein
MSSRRGGDRHDFLEQSLPPADPAPDGLVADRIAMNGTMENQPGIHKRLALQHATVGRAESFEAIGGNIGQPGGQPAQFRLRVGRAMARDSSLSAKSR